MKYEGWLSHRATGKLDKEHKEGWDKRARITMKEKMSSGREREPHPKWQSVMVRVGESAQDKKNKEWVS